MKIAILSAFYPYRGGIAQFNANIFRVMEQLPGVEVKAFTFSRQYPDLLFPGKSQYVGEQDVADRIPSQAVLDTVNPISYLTAARQIIDYAPDVLITRYWMPFFAPSLGMVAQQVRRKGVKVLGILDNVVPHERRMLDGMLTSYYLRQHDGFVVMSEAVKDDLLSFSPQARYLKRPHPLYDHFGNPWERAQAREALGLHPDKKTLLFFGFIRDYKGLDVLLESFGGLGPDYQLLIAGECYGSFDAYQAQIDALPNAADVHVFNDYISDDRVPVFFSASDVCVLPYKSATQSGIAAISFHFELPMIVTDVGGLKETIQPGRTGMVVEGPDPALVRTAVGQYFDSELQQPFRRNIQQMKEEHSWKAFTQQLLDFAKAL